MQIVVLQQAFRHEDVYGAVSLFTFTFLFFRQDKVRQERLTNHSLCPTSDTWEREREAAEQQEQNTSTKWEL